MSFLRLPFSQMDWIRGAHPLERKKTTTGSPMTLLEFAPGFRDPSWCVRGHAGLVLSGELRLELDDLSETIRSGEAFHLDPGTRHRAANDGPHPVVFFIVNRD